MSRLTVERASGELPTSMIFLHAADVGGGLGRSTYMLSQVEALALADKLRRAVATPVEHEHYMVREASECIVCTPVSRPGTQDGDGRG